MKKNSSPPLSLYGQLLWREFFYTAATNNPRFDKMEGNPICVQIPWDKNPEALAKWAEGRTGFPWIDAIMTQLRQEGWIHHLARHAVACFLTRGDLWISWEEGMKVSVLPTNVVWLYFEELYTYYTHTHTHTHTHTYIYIKQFLKVVYYIDSFIVLFLFFNRKAFIS